MILRLTFIALAFLLLSRCATVPLTGRHQLILFPEDQMVSMSLTSYSSFLKENKLSIKQISYSVGFKTPAHFSTAFKKRHEMTPSEYRASNTGCN